ncbi:MAG: hypothetical protein ACTSRW_16755 [Candidatus Helarchaeota archaeon]
MPNEDNFVGVTEDFIDEPEEIKGVVEELIDDVESTPRDGKGPIATIATVEGKEINYEVVSFLNKAKPKYAFKLTSSGGISVVFLRKCNRTLLKQLNIAEDCHFLNNWLVLAYLQEQSILITGFFGGIIQVEAIYKSNVLKTMNHDPLRVWSPDFITGKDKKFLSYIMRIPPGGQDLLTFNLNSLLHSAIRKEISKIDEEIDAFEENALALDIQRPSEWSSEEARNKYFTQIETFNTIQKHVGNLRKKREELELFSRAWEVRS